MALPSRKARTSTPVDAQNALAVVQHIYAAALDSGDPLWHTIIADLADFFGVGFAGAVDVDKASGNARVLAILGFDAAAVTAAFEKFGIEQDPLFGVVSQLPEGSTFLDDATLDPATLDDSEFCRALALAQQMQRHLVGVLQNDAAQYVGLSFWRSAQGPEFTDNERKALAWMMPHIRQAVSVQRLAQDAAAGGGPAKAPNWRPFHDSRHGIAVLDANGVVLLINQEGSRIVECGDAFRIEGGKLTSPDPVARRRLIEARAQAAGMTRGIASSVEPAFRVMRQSGRPAYQVIVTPIFGNEAKRRLPPAAAAFVTITDPTAYFRVSVDRLRAFGLTMAEARLCEALVRTGSLPRTADELGIAHGTARSHLKTIFGKLGVTTQIELVQSLVSSFPYPAGTGSGAG